MDKLKYILTIKAEDRPGLLHLLTGLLNRKLIPILSLTAAPTTVPSIMLISMELEISDKALQPLILKLQNIIEVFDVEATPVTKTVTQRCAYFRLDKAVLQSPMAATLKKWDMQVVSFTEDSVLLSKSGSAELINMLSASLAGSYSKGFSQTGLICDSELLLIKNEEQSSVIRWLAA